MFNGKFTITLIAMFACLIALFSTEFKHVTENFMHGTGYCGRPQDPTGFGPWGGVGQFTNVGNNVIRGKSHPRLTAESGDCAAYEFPTGLSTKRNMTTSVSPRFNSTGIPKMVRVAPPPVQVMANDHKKPIDPISAPLNSTEKKQTVERFDYDSAQVPLPQDMSNVDILGSESQPVIYDRLVYSNMRSRLRGQGDYIRGDLKITPDQYRDDSGRKGWFQVSVKPERDLNPGAMEHLFGRSEELTLSVAQGDLCVPTYGV
jgi:hypothetical protein